MNKKISILGAGAWGTALATLLADNGHTVTLWCYEPDVARDIITTGLNTKYFPNVPLPKSIRATSDMAQALEGAELIVESIPVKYFRSVLEELKKRYPHTRNLPWLLTSKGIEQETFLLPSEILQAVFGPTAYAVLSGPNFAREVVDKIVTATVIASTDRILADRCAAIFSNNYFHVRIDHDVPGAQIGGATKNVIALVVGIARGAGYEGSNTIAYLVAQGLAEVALLAKHYGGSVDTVYGLSGVGDLILTCFGTQSKNMRAGMMIGGGCNLDQVATAMNVLPEGIQTVQSIYKLAKKKNLNLPLCLATYDCVFNRLLFKDALARLA